MWSGKRGFQSFVSCVSACKVVSMEFSDDEEFRMNQTQHSFRNIVDDRNDGFMFDMIDNNSYDQVVSLEGGDEANFDLIGSFGVASTQAGLRILYDNVVIEDISSDEGIDKM